MHAHECDLVPPAREPCLGIFECDESTALKATVLDLANVALGAALIGRRNLSGSVSLASCPVFIPTRIGAGAPAVLASNICA